MQVETPLACLALALLNQAMLAVVLLVCSEMIHRYPMVVPMAVQLDFLELRPRTQSNHQVEQRICLAQTAVVVMAAQRTCSVERITVPALEPTPSTPCQQLQAMPFQQALQQACLPMSLPPLVVVAQLACLAQTLLHRAAEVLEVSSEGTILRL